MSAFENVELPMTILGKLDRKQRKKKARDLLRMVGLRDRENHLPSELSGGEQQRVTIARSLANDPSVLLLGSVMILCKPRRSYCFSSVVIERDYVSPHV